MALLKIFHYKVKSFIKRFFKCESGVTAIEYMILACALASGLYVIFNENGELNRSIVNIFSRLSMNVLNNTLN